MKATNFPCNEPGATGAWAKLTHVLMFQPPQRDGWRVDAAAQPEKRRRSGFLERLDRWFWRQQVRDREAYLSGAQDVFELEERIRRLERSVGSRYY